MRHIEATEDAAARVHSTARRHKAHFEMGSKSSGGSASAVSTASAMSSARPSEGWKSGANAACFLSSFFSCLRARRSRSACSRENFAIVVCLLELEAIQVPASLLLSKRTCNTSCVGTPYCRRRLPWPFTRTLQA